MHPIRPAIVVICLSVVSTIASAETLSEILNHVATRCRAYSTIDCKWKVESKFEESFAKQRNADPFGDDVAAVDSKQQFPATIMWMGSFQSDESKLRLSYNWPVWFFPDRRLRLRPRIVVSDGTEARSLDTYDSHSQSIWTKSQNPVNVGFDHHLIPLLTQFRAYQYPIASLFPPEAKDVKIDHEVWDGHECLVLRRSSSGGSREFTVWLDPESDYSVRRYTSTRAGVIEHDIRIQLTKRDGFWIPERWQWFDYWNASGELCAVHSAVLLEISVNQPINDALFELSFPRGTTVSDQRVVPNRELLIGSGGREFEITTRQLAKAGSSEALLKELDK